MRLLILPVCLVALIGAGPAPQSRDSAALTPIYTGSPERIGSGDDALAPHNCRDRIRQVREASGDPVLDKTPATADEGYLINAVDMRLDGCAVMQMKGNVNDLRPLPAPGGPARLQPAR